MTNIIECLCSREVINKIILDWLRFYRILNKWTISSWFANSHYRIRHKRGCVVIKSDLHCDQRGKHIALENCLRTPRNSIRSFSSLRRIGLDKVLNGMKLDKALFSSCFQSSYFIKWRNLKKFLFKEITLKLNVTGFSYLHLKSEIWDFYLNQWNAA